MEVEDRQRHLSSIAVVSAPRAPSVDPIFAVAAAQTSINTLVRFILRLGGRGALDSAQWRRTPASLQQRPPSMRLGRDVARAPSVDTILTAAAAQSSNNTLAVFLPRIGGSRWGWTAIDPATVEADRRPDRRSRGQEGLESPQRLIPRQIARLWGLHDLRHEGRPLDLDYHRHGCHRGGGSDGVRHGWLRLVGWRWRC
jgi:hypothetical protein